MFPVESYLYQTNKVINGVNQTDAGQNCHYIANRKLVVQFPKPYSGSTIKWQRVTVAIDDTVAWGGDRSISSGEIVGREIDSEFSEKVCHVYEDEKVDAN